MSPSARSSAEIARSLEAIPSMAVEYATPADAARDAVAAFPLREGELLLMAMEPVVWVWGDGSAHAACQLLTAVDGRVEAHWLRLYSAAGGAVSFNPNIRNPAAAFHVLQPIPNQTSHQTSHPI